MTLTAKGFVGQVSIIRASFQLIIKQMVFRALSPFLRWVLISLGPAVLEIFFEGFI